MLWIWGSPLGHILSSGCHFLIKNTGMKTQKISFYFIQQPSIISNSSARVKTLWPCSPHLHMGILSDLNVHRSYMNVVINTELSSYMQQLLYLETTLSLSSNSSGFFGSFCFLLHSDCRALKGWALHTLFFSEHLQVVGLCVNSHLQWKRSFSDEGWEIYWSMAIVIQAGVSFILCTFRRVFICSSFSPMAYDISKYSHVLSRGKGAKYEFPFLDQTLTLSRSNCLLPLCSSHYCTSGRVSPDRPYCRLQGSQLGMNDDCLWTMTNFWIKHSIFQHYER